MNHIEQAALMRKTNYKGSKDEVRALSAYVKLVRASESVMARIHRHLAGVGLTISQFGALEALYHLGPLSQAEIAKKVLKSTGNITMVIDNLEKRGLARRQRKEDDRRYYTVQLTPEGRKLIGSIFPRHAAKIVEEMKVLNSVEQESLGHLCRRLGLQVRKQQEEQL
jgi:MarR family transcriptional regulator, 2-MHQ and catechol-resistance regulon repressor